MMGKDLSLCFPLPFCFVILILVLIWCMAYSPWRPIALERALWKRPRIDETCPWVLSSLFNTINFLTVIIESFYLCCDYTNIFLHLS
jgi:hypothetical protein